MTLIYHTKRCIDYLHVALDVNIAISYNDRADVSVVYSYFVFIQNLFYFNIVLRRANYSYITIFLLATRERSFIQTI